MVHVTFNEKVECHQYTPSATIDEILAINRNDNRNFTGRLDSTNVQGRTRLNYNAAFLKALRNNPQSQICPDVVKKGFEDGKDWAQTTPDAVSSNPDWDVRNRWTANRSVFARPSSHYNGPKRLRPFYPPNFTNRDEMFGSIEPGRRRVDNQSSSYQVPDYENHYQNRNLMPDFAQRFDVRTSTDKNDEDTAVPEWYTGGPTSRDDVMELHGFEGPSNNENDGNTSACANSGASSNNSSPPAKSTPAKVIPTPMKNDAQRNKRPPSGRSNIWQNNFDNRQNVGAPILNDFFKNFSANQNKSNLRGLTPLRVEDVEASLFFERMKFKQMLAQMQLQQRYVHEPIPSAPQILIEMDKIICTTTEEIYKRPEVRALIKNIIESVIPPLNIMNLLKNPATETQNREVIHAAIRLYTLAKQNAITAMKSHTPTDAELRAHMDAILQDAIIKKRMENLSTELLKLPYQQGLRNFPNQAQSFHQMFPPNSVGLFQNYLQNDFRGQSQPVGNGSTAPRDNNLNRWFSPTLLNKGLSGALPQLPVSDPLRLDELENAIKQNLQSSEKNVK